MGGKSQMNLNDASWQPWKLLGALVTALVALSILHARFVVPYIISEARSDWRDDIKMELAPIIAIQNEQKFRSERMENKLDAILTDTRSDRKESPR